jgi:hypothetical protein
MATARDSALFGIGMGADRRSRKGIRVSPDTQ